MPNEVCQRCGKTFYVRPSVLKLGNGRGQYCSRECSVLARTVKRTNGICQECGKTFYVRPWDIKYGRCKFCSTSCRSKYNGRKNRKSVTLICKHCGKSFSVRPCESKNYCSADCRSKDRVGTHLPLEARSKISATHKGVQCSDNAKLLLSQSAKERYKAPENHPWYGKHLSEKHKQDIGNANRGRKRSESLKKRISETSISKWQDPAYVIKVMQSRQVRPTKPENKLRVILEAHFPDFKYNGDGSLGITLNGMIPDFFNVNGKKEVIEVFGDYWHSEKAPSCTWRRTELGRVMAYNSLGYRCLIFWEHELKSLTEEQIISKLSIFTRSTK